MKNSCAKKVGKFANKSGKNTEGGGVSWFSTAEIMKRKKHFEKGSLGAIG
jgi:hypothetical protein